MAKPTLDCDGVHDLVEAVAWAASLHARAFDEETKPGHVRNHLNHITESLDRCPELKSLDTPGYKNVNAAVDVLARLVDKFDAHVHAGGGYRSDRNIPLDERKVLMNAASSIEHGLRFAVTNRKLVIECK